MAFLAYIVASLSCGVLVALYWQQGNYLAAAVAALACVFFMARLFTARRAPDAAASGRPVGGASGDRARVRRELEEMLPPLRRNRAIMRNIFATGLLAGVGLGAVNLPLGLAVLGLALVPALLFFRSHQAVNLIEDGLGR